MIYHDVRCTVCNNIETDAKVGSVDQGITDVPCELCGSPTTTYYANYQDIRLMNDGRDVNDQADKNGYIRAAHAMTDPLCKIELGVHKHGFVDQNYMTFSPEQVQYYRGRVEKDGDSPKLRQEILEVRERNIRGTR